MKLKALIHSLLTFLALLLLLGLINFAFQDPFLTGKDWLQAFFISLLVFCVQSFNKSTSE